MKRRSLLVVLAVVLATVGTVGVLAYIRGADERAADSGRAVEVVIATERVTAGTTWADARRSGALSVQHLPASATPASAITSLDVGIAQDSVAQSDITPGSPVLRNVFGPATPQTGVLAIPKGMVAISITLSSDGDVAGYVQPKSQVAVFVTAPLKQDAPPGSDPAKTSVTTPSGSMTGNELTVTRTLVPRALVIASSQASPTSLVASDSSGATQAGASVLVTLALSQRDAERIINQQKIGQLTLGLLSADSQLSQDGGYTNTGAFRTRPIWEK